MMKVRLHEDIWDFFWALAEDSLEGIGAGDLPSKRRLRGKLDGGENGPAVEMVQGIGVSQAECCRKQPAFMQEH